MDLEATFGAGLSKIITQKDTKCYAIIVTVEEQETKEFAHIKKSFKRFK